MTTEYDVRDIPQDGRIGGRPNTKWKLLTEALLANAGKSIFVAANGTQPLSIRSSGISQIPLYVGPGHKLHTRMTGDGVYFWLTESL